MVKFNGSKDMFGKLEFGEKKNMPEDAKIKLKWKTIQYLLENKQNQIEVLGKVLHQSKTTQILKGVNIDENYLRMQDKH